MKIRRIVIIAAAALLLGACGPKWSFSVASTYHKDFIVDGNLVTDLQDLKDEGICEGLPLEIAFYQQGIEVIDSIQITAQDGQTYELDGMDLVDERICVSEKGSIDWQGIQIIPESISIKENELAQSTFNIQDIPASAAYALGLEMEGLAGSTLVDETYDHVFLFFLDGFGYHTYLAADELGIIPNITEGGTVTQALTVFPPRTSTSSAALMTGLTPNQSGVYKSGIRKTESMTIFDKALEAGVTTIAIEGEALAFNMRNTEAILSGDRDLNGATDDNTFQNTIERLKQDVPDLVWIHFHGIDDCGHTYGPNSDEVMEKIAEVNRYVGQIETLIPVNSLIIIFSDHGMHAVQEEDEKGNHGNLIYEDMVIPIIIKTK